jgi:hypothetical protein
MMRGGTIENVFMRDVHVGVVDRSVIDIDLYYEEGTKGDHTPIVRNILVERMTVDTCKTALNLVGYEHAPLRNITLVDCVFGRVTGGYRIEHVEGLTLKGTTVNGKELSQ